MRSKESSDTWGSASRCLWSWPRVCFGEYRPKHTCVVSHKPECVPSPVCAWVAEIVARAFLVTGRNCQPCMPKGKWDIQCMVSIKWSLSCWSSNEILYLCLRLLRLLDVTLKSCVTLYLLLTDDMTAGWPYHPAGDVWASMRGVRMCLWCACGWI